MSAAAKRDEWYLDHHNLADLAEWLLEGGDSDKAVVEMLHKPWNWGAEFRQMLADRAEQEKDRREATPELRRIEAAEDLEPLLEASIAVARGARGR